jgi:hypothetical protein
MMLKLKMSQILLTVCSALLFFSATIAFSAETKLLTSIGLKQEYNSNILYSRADEIDDFITYVIPALKLTYVTELLNLTALADWNGWLYWDNSDLNRINQRYGLSGDYRLTERWSVSADGLYVKDSTQDSQYDETGSVRPGISDRQRLNLGAGVDYAMSERTNLGGEYEFQKTDYERSSSVDTIVNTVNVYWSHQLKNQKDIISIIPEFTYGTSDDWDAYNPSLNFRWERLFTETLDSSVLIGLRNTNVEYDDDRDDSTDWGGVADMWLRKRGELTTGRVGFMNDLRTRESGEIVNVSRLYADIDHLLSRRFGLGLRGSFYYSNLIEDSPETDDDRWSYDVSPSAFYRLTEDHILRLLYSYGHETFLDVDDDDTRDRHRIWLQLTFNFPKTW